MEEEIEYTNARERFSVRQQLVPKVDTVVSKIVGKNILVLDPRLIKIMAKWKAEKHKDEKDLTPDNFLKDESKIKELRELFNN